MFQFARLETEILSTYMQVRSDNKLNTNTDVHDDIKLLSIPMLLIPASNYSRPYEKDLNVV